MVRIIAISAAVGGHCGPGQSVERGRPDCPASRRCGLSWRLAAVAMRQFAILGLAGAVLLATSQNGVALAQGLRPAGLAEGIGYQKRIDPKGPDDIFDLARRFEHGEGVPRDLARALELYCQSALAGHPAAAHSIGWIYLNGRGGAQSDAMAAAWFKRAVERGHVFSNNLLRHLTGAPAVDDPEEACPESVRTGAHWRSASTAKLEGLAPKEIKTIAEHWAQEFDLDPNLVLAVITVESAFKPDAVSTKEAQGLMQLIPATATRFGVTDAFDAWENVRGGTQYLRWLVDHFDGNLKLALAGYNSGEGAVARYGGVPPYPETQGYLRKIYRLYDHPDLREAASPDPVIPVEVPVEALALSDYLKSRD